MKSYTDSLAIRHRLVKSDLDEADWQGDLSVSYEKIGDVHAAQGDLTSALKSYEESFAIREQLAKSDHSNAGWQRSLCAIYAKLASGYRASKDIKRAREKLVAGREVISKLIRQHPDWLELKKDLARFEEQTDQLGVSARETRYRSQRHTGKAA